MKLATRPHRFHPLPRAIAAFALFVSGCVGSPPPAPSSPSTSSSLAEAPAARAGASGAEGREAEQLVVPAAVAKLHRKLFEPHAAEEKLGRAVCVVTLSNPSTENGQFFPLMLVASGAVATWRHTSEGPKEVFQAKLHPEELRRAKQLIDAVPRQAAGRVDAPRTVIGVSTRLGEHVHTRYFDVDALPASLNELIGMLKQRLEATNRRPDDAPAR